MVFNFGGTTDGQVMVAICYQLLQTIEDRGNTVVKVLCYKSEGLWLTSTMCTVASYATTCRNVDTG